MPLLLDGYRGMKECEDAILPQGKVRLSGALGRLVALYTATGKAEEVKEWEAERVQYPVEESPDKK